MAHSEKTKIKALTLLALYGGNVSRTAREMGLPWVTVKQWAKGQGINADITKNSEHEKESLADAFERIAWKCIRRLHDSKLIDECNRPSELSTVAGTAVDKSRLLRGEPTSHVRTEYAVSPVERAGRVLSIVDRLRKTA